ncbi:MAG: hypothetical protein JO257_06845 [Deltaproteobacteria bacterium]|nr:hypothetical protein [Deltaproteobacteria bacterium]
MKKIAILLALVSTPVFADTAKPADKAPAADKTADKAPAKTDKAPAKTDKAPAKDAKTTDAKATDKAPAKTDKAPAKTDTKATDAKAPAKS